MVKPLRSNLPTFLHRSRVFRDEDVNFHDMASDLGVGELVEENTRWAEVGDGHAANQGYKILIHFPSSTSEHYQIRSSIKRVFGMQNFSMFLPCSLRLLPPPPWLQSAPGSRLLPPCPPSNVATTRFQNQSSSCPVTPLFIATSSTCVFRGNS